MSIEQVRDAPELMTVRLPDGFTETYVKLSDYRASESAAVALRARVARLESALDEQHAGTDALYNEKNEVMKQLAEAWAELSKEQARLEESEQMAYDFQTERDTLTASLARVTPVVDAVIEMSKDWTAYQAAFLHMHSEYNGTLAQERTDKAFDRLEKLVVVVDALAAPVDAGETK